MTKENKLKKSSIMLIEKALSTESFIVIEKNVDFRKELYLILEKNRCVKISYINDSVAIAFSEIIMLDFLKVSFKYIDKLLSYGIRVIQPLVACRNSISIDGFNFEDVYLLLESEIRKQKLKPY